MWITNVIWILVLTGLGFWACLRATHDTKGRWWFVGFSVASLLIHFAMSIFMYLGGTESTGTDGLIYHQISKSVADQLWRGIPIHQVEYGYTWYTLYQGIVYAIFGINRYAVSFLNGFLVLLGGISLFQIGHEIGFSVRKRTTIAVIWQMMPSMLIWTSDSRKEAIAFLLALWIWQLTLHLMKSQQQPRHAILKTILVGLLLWVSTMLRIYMLYTLAFGILGGLAVAWVKTKQKRHLYFGAVILATVLVVTGTNVLVGMRDYHAIPLDRSQGGDENLEAEVGSLLQVVMNQDIPKVLNGFLTKPHLRDIQQITDIKGNVLAIGIVSAEMILWYLLMFVALFGIAHILLKMNPFLIGLLLFVLSYSAINALIAESIAETYFRYRAFIVAPVLLLADFRPLMIDLRQRRLSVTHEKRGTQNE